MFSVTLLLLHASPASATTPSRLGELTITEFQADPQEVAQYYGEWFKVYNNYLGSVDLIGVTFVTDSGSFTVERSLPIGVDDYVVFAVSAETTSTAMTYNGGVTADYTYSFEDVNLSLSGDSIRAYNGSTLLDEVVWTSGWSIIRDSAHQASLNAYDVEWANDFSNNWCSAGDRYGANNMFGTPGAENSYCSADPGRDTDGDGYTETDGDCNDDNADINSGEIDGSADPYGDANDDANCDGTRDDGDMDNDQDGYTPVLGDCDDTDADTYPGAVEIIDSEDNNCNDCVDDIDNDGDGYGWSTANACGDDCSSNLDLHLPDTEASVYPGANEVPYDGLDQDCDGLDECDVDEDGYKSSTCICDAENQIPCPDCDDVNASIHPGAIEDPDDGVDNDCDGEIDVPDRDGDGVTEEDGDCMDISPETDQELSELSAQVYPGSPEKCGNLVDDDCDGFFDNLPECTVPSAYATVRGGGLCGVAPASGGALPVLLAATMALVATVRRRGERA